MNDDDGDTVVVEFGMTGHYPCIQKPEDKMKNRIPQEDILRDSLEM